MNQIVLDTLAPTICDNERKMSILFFQWNFVFNILVAEWIEEPPSPQRRNERRKIFLRSSFGKREREKDTETVKEKERERETKREWKRELGEKETERERESVEEKETESE